MPARRFVLASASPARLRLLRDAGLAPEVVVSGVDEDDVTGDAASQALALAERKAAAVAPAAGDALVLGCDSLLDVGGEVLGKPVDAADATERLLWMRGRWGTLTTGHCVIDARSGQLASDVARTVVRFGHYTDREIESYVATGEPLHVAGSFTLDGRSAPFLAGIDGDAGNVIGCSLPLLRTLLRRLGVEIVDLWA